jgi:aromatic-amino-acid transaminase
VIRNGRVVTVQALGGTGALKVAADFLRRVLPGAAVWISDPSWENHRALFEQAGFLVNSYRYYEAGTRGLDFEGMIAAIDAMPAGDVIVLHACCHNPTGADPTEAQWETIIERVRARGLAPILDFAIRDSAMASMPMRLSCAGSRQRRDKCSLPARTPNRFRCTASGSARCPS